MSEMIERVARRLLKAHFERGRGIAPPWGTINKFEQEMWLYSARAALTEIREPTEAMSKAGGAVRHYTSEIEVGAEAPDVWQAMIDEAIKP